MIEDVMNLLGRMGYRMGERAHELCWEWRHWPCRLARRVAEAGYAIWRWAGCPQEQEVPR